MKTPPGYESLDATTRHSKVMKPKKSLYRLRQSLGNWFNTIDDSLRGMGFTSTASDPCVYIFYGTDDNIIILAMYVDDFLLGGYTPLLKDLKSQLMGRFPMTDLGDVSLMLGMQLTRDREAETLNISHEHYARSVLARFGMAEYNPVHTTGAGAESFLKQSDTMLLDSTGIELYQAITGSLMFLSQCTRYDIIYTVNQLARAMSKSFKLHMTAAKAFSPLPKGRCGPGYHVPGTRQCVSN